MLSLPEIRDRLLVRPAVLIGPGDLMHAAVAAVLCEEARGPKILFIRRTERDGDPWSGHLGFPGGRVDAADRGPREAAERETREEVGLDLRRAEHLGRLDDLRGAHVPLVVSCFVYGLPHRPALSLDEGEVADAFWFPLADLSDLRLRRQKTFRFQGEELSYPAIQLPDPGQPPLWGITYRLVSRLLTAAGRSL
jgi:8-oxo-dGTP pyrophosphatase MutT (NUDIX family)